MIRVGRFELELLEADYGVFSVGRVGAFRRWAKGRRYVSPRILFSSREGELVGRRFASFRGRAFLRKSVALEGSGVYMSVPGASDSCEGDFFLFFFPDDGGFLGSGRGELRDLLARASAVLKPLD